MYDVCVGLDVGLFLLGGACRLRTGRTAAVKILDFTSCSK